MASKPINPKGNQSKSTSENSLATVIAIMAVIALLMMAFRSF